MRLAKRMTLVAPLLVSAQTSPLSDANVIDHFPGEVPSVRNYFYVGGGYADDGQGAHIFRDQMYVEQLKPVNEVTRSYPIVIIHGQAQTGTVCFGFKFGNLPSPCINTNYTSSVP
jgi:hypothetical protein